MSRGTEEQTAHDISQFSGQLFFQDVDTRPECRTYIFSHDMTLPPNYVLTLRTTDGKFIDDFSPHWEITIHEGHSVCLSLYHQNCQQSGGTLLATLRFVVVRNIVYEPVNQVSRIPFVICQQWSRGFAPYEQ